MYRNKISNAECVHATGKWKTKWKICKSILDWIKLLTATLKQKPFQFEISVQSVPSSWNGINESILSSSLQANTQVTSLHLLIVGHKANKLVCECRGNSTVPHQTGHMPLGLAATAAIDLELYNYPTVFCSPCPCLSLFYQPQCESAFTLEKHVWLSHHKAKYGSLDAF